MTPDEIENRRQEIYKELDNRWELVNQLTANSSDDDESISISAAAFKLINELLDLGKS